MNKYIKRFCTAALSISVLFAAQGCDKYFDVGNNPNQVTNPNINNLLSTATHKTGINSRTFASFSSYYTQYLASPSEGSATDTYQITDLSGTWNQVYYTMADIYDMLKMAEEQEAHLHAGIGKLLMAYNLSLVIDTWNSGPYDEAFMNVESLYPTYQSGEQLYGIIGQLITDGLADLRRSDSKITLNSGLDLIHGGDINAWIRTGYGLQARHLNKISKKSTYNPTAVLTALDNSYTSAAHDMKLSVYVGNNPWASVAISNAGSLLGGWLSSHLIDHLNGTIYGFEDPRVGKITDKTVDGVYKGTQNGRGNVGAANTIKDECYISINSPVTSTTAPIYIMTYEELKFVEAEAALRASQAGRAYNAYLEGIRATMAKLEVPQADADAYLAHPTVAVGADNLTLDLIFKEKYVATYLHFEAWNDARRYDYAYAGFQLPYNAALNTFVRRVAYPVAEQTRNPDNVPGEEPLSSPLWWDRP